MTNLRSCSLAPQRVTINYRLVASGNTQHAHESEPIAICTIRTDRTSEMLRWPLVAWHLSTKGQPIFMPVEETAEATHAMYVGRFLLLPRKELTLFTHEPVPIVQLALSRSSDPRICSDWEASSWDVAAVSSDGYEISLNREKFSHCVSGTSALRFSDAQLCAFVRLGGLIRGFVQPVNHLLDLTYGGDAGAEGHYILYEHALDRNREHASHVTTFSQWRVAIEQAGLNLEFCRLMLPPLCWGCQLPMNEEECVKTLWGKWMHFACIPQGGHQVGHREETGIPYPAPLTQAEGPLNMDFQPALPWVS